MCIRDRPNVIQLDTCMTATVDSVAPLLDLKPYLDKSDTLKLDNFYDTFQEEAYVGDNCLLYTSRCV